MSRVAVRPELPALSQTPLAEALYLPLSAVAAATGLAAACLRITSLVTGLQTGWFPYVVLFLAALTGVAFSSINGVFDLPRTLRLADFAGTLLISSALLYFAPTVPGQLQLFGSYQVVTLLTVGPFALLLAWFFGTVLALAVPRVFPLSIDPVVDPFLAQRLGEESAIRSIYSGSTHSIQAQAEAWRMAYGVIMTIALVYLGFTAFWTPAAPIRTDLALAAWSGIALAGLMSYLALTNLAATRRTNERQSLFVMLPGYARAWGYGVVYPTIAAAILGCILPHSFSPLAGIDWNSVMDRFTQWIVSFWWVSKPGRGAGGYVPSYTGSSVGGGSGSLGVVGGSGGTGPEPLMVFLGLIAIVYVAYRGIKIVSQFLQIPIAQEKNRSRGMLALFVAILTWPFRVVHALFRRARQSGAVASGELASLASRLGKKGQSRRTRLQFPEDPALFVRFAYGRMLRGAAQAGLQRRKNQTALEFAHTLASSLPDTAQPVRELTTSYCNVRYSTQLPAATIRAQALVWLRMVSQALRRNRHNHNREANDSGMGGHHANR